MIDLSTFYFDNNRSPISTDFLYEKSLVCKDNAYGKGCSHQKHDPDVDWVMLTHQQYKPVDYLAKLKAIEFINSLDLDKIDFQYIVSLLYETGDLLSQFTPHADNPNYNKVFDYFDNISEIELTADDISFLDFFFLFRVNLRSFLSSIAYWITSPRVRLFVPICNVCGNTYPGRYFAIENLFFNQLLELADHDFVFFKFCHIMIFYKSTSVPLKTVANSMPGLNYPEHGVIAQFPDAPLIVYQPIAGVLPILPEYDLYSDFVSIPTITSLLSPSARKKHRVHRTFLNPVNYSDSSRFFVFDDFSRLIPPDFSFKKDGYPRIMEADDPLCEEERRVWKDSIYIKTAENRCYPIDHEELCIFCHYPRSQFGGTLCPHCNNDFGSILEKYAQKSDHE